MEKLINSTKRKKRRTRKCLNEIRNRSRRKISGNSFEQSTLTKVCILEAKTNNRLLTMDRITLNSMFPRAIQSETITRPALAEIKQKQNVNLVDFVRDKVKANNITLSVNPEIVSNTLNISSSLDNIPIADLQENSIGKEIDSENHDFDLKASSSSILFSPTSPINKCVTRSKLLSKEDPITSTLTSSSSQTSHGDYTHHLYKEFMSEIPSYFRNLNSSIIKEDVIKSTMNNLQKLYFESCQKEYEDNILNCINGHIMPKNNTFCSQNQAIAENPLDIRLDHARQQSVLRRRGTDSSSSGSARSAASPTWRASLRSSAAPHTPEARRGRCAPVATRVLDVVMYDTPEYTYYPHRLN